MQRCTQRGASRGPRQRLRYRGRPWLSYFRTESLILQSAGTRVNRTPRRLRPCREEGPPGSRGSVQRREPSVGLRGGERGPGPRPSSREKRASARDSLPPSVLVLDGFEGQEAVIIQRLEDAELSARAGTIPMCDDSGVIGGGLPAEVGAEAGTPESLRRAGPGAGGAARYRHFKLPPQASKGRGVRPKPKAKPPPPLAAGTKQPRAPLQLWHTGSGQRRGPGECTGNGNT